MKRDDPEDDPELACYAVMSPDRFAHASHVVELASRIGLEPCRPASDPCDLGHPCFRHRNALASAERLLRRVLRAKGRAMTSGTGKQSDRL